MRAKIWLPCLMFSMLFSSPADARPLSPSVQRAGQWVGRTAISFSKDAVTQVRPRRLLSTFIRHNAAFGCGTSVAGAYFGFHAGNVRFATLSLVGGLFNLVAQGVADKRRDRRADGR